MVPRVAPLQPTRRASPNPRSRVASLTVVPGGGGGAGHDAPGVAVVEEEVGAAVAGKVAVVAAGAGEIAAVVAAAGECVG